MNRLITLCLAAVCTLAGAAQGAEPDVQAELEQLRQSLAEQREQIRQLRGRVDREWLHEQRREQVRALVHEVLADAETRTSMQEGALTAGHDGKTFFLASGDGRFLLRIFGQLQTRYYFNHTDGPAEAIGGDASPDETRSGFTLHNSYIGFRGHVYDPSWRYMIWLGHNTNGDAVLLDAYVTKQLNGQWSVTAGQFKLPFLYEYLVSATRLQFVDRSLISGEFAGTYTQGVMLTYRNDWLSGRASFNDGLSTLNTPWQEATSEFALTGRAEVKLAGDWKQYADWQGWRDQPFFAALGAAVHYQEGEHGTTDDELDDLRWTVDASVEFAGANLFAAVVGCHAENGDDIDQLSTVLQGGYFLTDRVELIGRYEWSDPDVAGEADLSVLTAGVNYFFHRHDLKLTLDVGYAFNPVAATFASEPLGWREDEPGQDGQVLVRSQIQLLF